MTVRPFDPSYGNTVTLSVTTSAVSGLMATTPDGRNTAVTFTNAGPSLAWVRITPDSVSTSAVVGTDMPILANSQVTLTKAPDWNRVSAIAASGTATLYATPGQGV